MPVRYGAQVLDHLVTGHADAVVREMVNVLFSFVHHQFARRLAVVFGNKEASKALAQLVRASEALEISSQEFFVGVGL